MTFFFADRQRSFVGGAVRAKVLFELARTTEDSFERLVHVLKALELEARAHILQEEESRSASAAAAGSGMRTSE